VSPNNVTPVREADDSPPEISASPPGFPSVRVYYQGSRDEGKGLWFEYCGTLEDLVAGGAATPEMLRMNPGTGLATSASMRMVTRTGLAGTGVQLPTTARSAPHIATTASVD